MENKKLQDLRKFPLYYSLILTAWIVHILFEGFFIYWDVPLMKAYNIVSIFVFSIGLKLIRRYQKEVIFLCFVEATVFIALATFSMGWDYGFQNWIFAFLIVAITVPFKERRYFYILGIVQALLYVLLYFVVYRETQWNMLYQLEGIFVLLNITFVFAIIFFADRVLGISKAMEILFLQKKVEEIKQSVVLDEMTGLLSRRRMNQILSDWNERLQLEDLKFFLIFGDIDHFKRINDTYGHEFGDTVLKQVAGILSRELRGEDIVARWGGEEFLILIKDKPYGREALKVSEVRELLSRVRKRVEESPIYYGEEPISVTITFGGVSSKSYRDIYEMIRQADEQMYRGKREGRNRVEIEE